MQKIFVGLFIVGLSLVFLLNSNDMQVFESEGDVAETEVAELQQVEASESSVEKEIAQFTPEEFSQLFNNLALPNTISFVEPPEITGDISADEKIRNIAEARGYQLQTVPSSELIDLELTTVQKLLVDDWRDLKEAAQNDGIELVIRSGYRSVNAQREIFLRELNSVTTDYDAIAEGSFDQAINDLLATVAPPGYSRHHSGYTIDIADTSATVFEFSGGFNWISSNNYENAKKYGFIPSYPDGSPSQGPDPEPWEYVWANRDFVVE